MHFKSATELVAALQARQLSAAELTDATIDRIKSHDVEINAVVVRDFKRAKVAAAQADAALARGDRRPLLGLPITVKEAFNVAGLPTTWGIPGTENIPVDHDAVAVSRLKNAGAIVIGKTNVPTQLADWQTFNPIYGTTNNPWNPARTPGGSSGGSAACLAAGFVSLELGTDLNGSLRVPAHCCGVFAHKPSYGLVPMRGCSPPGVPMLSISADIDLAVAGPMARSAADLALGLDVLAGPDDSQATAYSIALPAPRHARLADFRVLVLDEHPHCPLSSEVRAALEDYARKLRQAGCKLGRSSPLLPDLALTATTFSHLLMAFVGVDMPEATYEGLKTAMRKRPLSDSTMEAAELRGLVSTHRDWVTADRMRIGIQHQWRQLFKEWDVVLCPVLPTSAFAHDHTEMESRRIDIDGRGFSYKGLATWCSVASLAGLPATAMPVGLGSDGLPIGIQVVGPHLEDRTTIGFAKLAEREFGGFVVPPAFER
jgi:amidase